VASLWLETRPEIASDAFSPDASYDAVVVGAGLTGVTTGLLLARAGLRVAILEAREAGAVTTGNTTAKLSLLQGTMLSSVKGHHGADAARHYVTGNREGQSWLLRFCDEHGVGYERRDAITYATTHDGAASLEDEYAACIEAGLEPVLEQASELPFPVTSALRLPEQAQIHPLEVLAALVAEFRSHGGQLIEGVRVQGAGKDGSRIEVRTARGMVGTEHLVLASGFPILDRGGHFAVLKPQRSYAAAFAVEDQIPQGMYLSIDSPSRSLRTATVHGQTYLLAGGNGHPVGRQSHTQELLDDLMRWTQRHFPTSRPAYTWSAQDYEPAAAVPYVGRLPFAGQNIYAATGYNKWGMTNSVAAALALSGEILGGNMPWADGLYRGRPSLHDAATTAKFGAAVGLELVSGWLGGLVRNTTSIPPEGQGVVVREGARPAGICTVDGVTHRVSAVCPHMGGALSWNDAERSWDCPLHGSRFTADGKVLEGPATRDLPPAGS
jgi:glycine/D-amino acid oxidase-like deaminating enzyme/nitrite reductase/ring-hydroxylating ferredoxin subunit